MHIHVRQMQGEQDHYVVWGETLAEALQMHIVLSVGWCQELRPSEVVHDCCQGQLDSLTRCTKGLYAFMHFASCTREMQTEVLVRVYACSP